MTPRLEKLRKEWEDAEVVVCPECSFSFTKSYITTEGQPLTLRDAKAFASIMKETPISIRDGELIAGSLTKHIRGCDVLAAECPNQVLDAIAKGSFDRKMSEWTSAYIDPEDVKLLKKDAEYWATQLPAHEQNAAVVAELGVDHLDLMMDKEGAYINPSAKPKPHEKRVLLRSMIICCEAVIEWAHRYADLARNLAKEESNPVRKKNLRG